MPRARRRASRLRALFKRRPRRAPGPRRRALRERRRRARRRLGALGVAGAAVAVVATLGLGALDRGGQGRPGAPSPSVAAPAMKPPDPLRTTLVFGTREDDQAAGAVWLALVGLNHRTGQGAVVYIPADTGVEVPGRGLGGVGGAFASGGAPLLLASAESLLGIEIDSYLELSDRDARVLFGVLGELSVDVPADVRVAAGRGQARLLLAAGRQTLSPEFLVRLLYTVGLDANELDLGSRHVAFWDALLDAYRPAPASLAAALERAASALRESDAPVGEHAAALAGLARLDEADLTIALLPVQALGVGGSELYATSPAELTDFLGQALGARPGLEDEVRVQVLNGNGVPGIGQQVAARLGEAGLRVFLSGNASRLNHRTTKIVVYDPGPEARALAEQVRALLGVGEILVSVQRQGIVDLTIIVGRDFLEVAG